MDFSAAVVAALAGLSAAWVAAGSTGLLAHPFRRALTLLLLVVAVLVWRPLWGFRHKVVLALAVLAFGTAAWMIALPAPPVNTMAAVVILAFLAFTSAGRSRDILLATSTAIAVFGIYRFAVTSIPWFWLGADLVGRSLGVLAGWLAGRPLRVGSAFAGLDFLVLMSILWALYLPHTKPPRAARAIYGFLAILGGQGVYLLLLACVPDLLAVLPQSTPSAGESSAFVQLVRRAVPWNLPVAACVIHALIA